MKKILRFCCLCLAMFSCLFSLTFFTSCSNGKILSVQTEYGDFSSKLLYQFSSIEIFYKKDDKKIILEDLELVQDLPLYVQYTIQNATKNYEKKIQIQSNNYPTLLSAILTKECYNELQIQYSDRYSWYSNKYKAYIYNEITYTLKKEYLVTTKTIGDFLRITYYTENDKYTFEKNIVDIPISKIDRIDYA